MGSSSTFACRCAFVTTSAVWRTALVKQPHCAPTAPDRIMLMFPLKLREIWALRTRLEMAGRVRELALFNLAIDSKLRGCDLVQLRVNDVARGGEVLTRASVVQQKTREPVRFEVTEPTRIAVSA